jgi:hypothetical protein
MPVYVDALVNYGTGKGYWKDRKSCHLIADSVDELIDFAVGIGLQKSWFQQRSSPHFDLDEEKRILAVKKGAIELERFEFVKKLQEIRANAINS